MDKNLKVRVLFLLLLSFQLFADPNSSSIAELKKSQQKTLSQSEFAIELLDRLPPEITGEDPGTIIGPLGEYIPREWLEDELFYRYFYREEIKYCDSVGDIYLNTVEKMLPSQKIKLDIKGLGEVTFDVEANIAISKYQKRSYIKPSTASPILPEYPVCIDGKLLGDFGPIDSFYYTANTSLTLKKVTSTLNSYLPKHKPKPRGQCVGEKATAQERDFLLDIVNAGLQLKVYPFIESPFTPQNSEYISLSATVHVDKYECVKDSREKEELGGLITNTRYFGKYNRKSRTTLREQLKFENIDRTLNVIHGENIYELRQSEFLTLLQRLESSFAVKEEGTLYLDDDLILSETFQMTRTVNSGVADLIDILIASQLDE